MLPDGEASHGLAPQEWKRIIPDQFAVIRALGWRKKTWLAAAGAGRMRSPDPQGGRAQIERGRGEKKALGGGPMPPAALRLWGG